LYARESSIVHGRGKKPAIEDAKQLFFYAQKAVEAAISLRTLLRGELVTKLDNEHEKMLLETQPIPAVSFESVILCLLCFQVRAPMCHKRRPIMIRLK
jgi:hypothetical protein